LVLDAVDQFWRDWVLTYDLDHQVALAARMQSAGRGWSSGQYWSELSAVPAWLKTNRSVLLGGTVTLGVGAMAAAYGPTWWLWWGRRRRLQRAQRGQVEPSDATLLYERMLTVLERRGLRKPAWLTPQEFARVLPPSELALLVDDLTTAYNQVRFGGQRDAAPAMARLLHRIEHAS
jgi:hypothetical protein